MRHVQDNYELMDGEKMYCIESMKEKDIVIASLIVKLQKSKNQKAKDQVEQKPQAKDNKTVEEPLDKEVQQGNKEEKIEEEGEPNEKMMQQKMGKKNYKKM